MRLDATGRIGQEITKWCLVRLICFPPSPQLPPLRRSPAGPFRAPTRQGCGAVRPGRLPARCGASSVKDGKAGVMQPDARPWRAWYQTAAWRDLRRARLKAEPVCRSCEALGRSTLARVVDHVRPHKGDRALFFALDNTQSLCAACHDAGKQRAERAGYSAAAGADGWPVDPAHPANAWRAGGG